MSSTQPYVCDECTWLSVKIDVAAARSGFKRSSFKLQRSTSMIVISAAVEEMVAPLQLTCFTALTLRTLSPFSSSPINPPIRMWYRPHTILFPVSLGPGIVQNRPSIRIRPSTASALYFPTLVTPQPAAGTIHQFLSTHQRLPASLLSTKRTLWNRRRWPRMTRLLSQPIGYVQGCQ